MIDTLTITGTPDQGRHRLEESGDLDTAILLSPSYHLAQEEIAANYPAMADAFAARRARSAASMCTRPGRLSARLRNSERSD